MLVADDSASLRALVRITLTSQGWSVLETETAEGALAITRSQRPDLVLLDITFGETGPDGLAVCAEIKSDAATASIPVVMLTAHDDPLERRRADAARADAFVAKPFGPLELTEILRGLIPAMTSTPALGVYLLDAGAIQTEQLEAALSEQRELVQHGASKPLGEVLRERGLVSSQALDRALLEQLYARIAGRDRPRGRLLIIDDHAAVREGLRSLILDDDHLEVVAEAQDAEEGLRLARRHRPDVIVLDAQMPVRSGLDVIPDLRRELPIARIVVFSLDHSARESALAAGATAFVPKDAPMKDILAALHLTEPDRPASSDAQLPPAHRRRLGDGTRRRAPVVLGAVLVSYVGLFLVAETAFGASAGAFAVLPVALIGALLGPELGLLGAVLVILCTGVLWAVTGHDAGEPVLQIGGQGLGIVVLVLVGVGAGAMRLLGLHLDPRRRRADAFSEIAQAIGTGGHDDLSAALLDGMLGSLGGDLALLFTNVAGDARVIAASQRGVGADAERVADLARSTMRSASPSIVDDLAETQRPVPDARSALCVPISVPGEDVQGVVILVHHRRAAFVVEDLPLARGFAQQLWVIMRASPAFLRRSGMEHAHHIRP